MAKTEALALATRVANLLVHRAARLVDRRTTDSTAGAAARGRFDRTTLGARR